MWIVVAYLDTDSERGSACVDVTTVETVGETIYWKMYRNKKDAKAAAKELTHQQQDVIGWTPYLSFEVRERKGWHLPYFYLGKALYYAFYKVRLRTMLKERQ